MSFIRNIISWAVASITAYVFGSAFQTQFIANKLAKFGAPMSFKDRMAFTLSDIQGLVAYLGVIAIAFAIGFFIASLVKRDLPGLNKVAYPVAGATSIGLALYLMRVQFELIPVSGADSSLGFTSQVIAGAMGGWVFERLRPKPN